MSRFSILTWNLENFFRPRADAGPDEHERYRRKLALLAGVLQRAEADVMTFQEVGGADALADLAEALAPAPMFHAVSSAPDGRGIRVGAISRLPLDVVEDVVAFAGGPATLVHDLDERGRAIASTRLGRGALHFTVQAAEPVHVIVTHLKSKLLSYRRPGGQVSFVPRDDEERAQAAGIALQRRSAEAVTLRLAADRVLLAGANPRVVLLGDLNDVPEAQTTLLLTGPAGSEIGTRGFDRDDLGDRTRLFNLAALIALERRYSRISFGRRELIDQILVSQAMLPRDADGHRRLPQVDALVDFADGLPSVGEDAGARDREIAPDHAPVIATFEL